MPPESSDTTGVLFEGDVVEVEAVAVKPGFGSHCRADDRKPQLVWRNIVLFAYLHIAAIYGAFLFLTSAKWQTDLFGKYYIK